ncbi:MAG TPA: AIM24 family protein [Cellvibrionaceae bacterium]
MSNSYNVVLTGELLKGQSIMQAANSLSKLFKIAPLQAQQMLARAPLVIKKNLEEDTALRFVQAMYKSGFGAAVEEQKAVKTTILMHSFSSHYHDDEDDADEEPATTSITPVLVEQSRLEESLDTELTIPVVSMAPVTAVSNIVAPQISHAAINAAAEINVDEKTSTESQAVLEALAQSAEAQISMLVAQTNQQGEIDRPLVNNPESICTAQVDEASEIDASETDDSEIDSSKIDVSEKDASEVESGATDTKASFDLVVSPQEIAPDLTEQPIDETGELSEQNLVTETSVANADLSEAHSYHPFAVWNTDAAAGEAATDKTSVDDTLVNEALVTQTHAAQIPAAEAQSAQNEFFETFSSLTSPSEIAAYSTDAQVIDAFNDDARASILGTSEAINSGADAIEQITVSSEQASNDSIESVFTADGPTAERIEQSGQSVELAPELAELVDVEPSIEAEAAVDAVAPLESDLVTPTAQTEAIEVVEAEASAESDLTDLQWVEPVAQWQTVAELAESGEVEQLHANTSNSVALNRASTDAIVGYGAGSGGDFSDHRAEVTRFDDEPTEPPVTWDESVEITQALTDRLAQIAEESKAVDKPSEDDSVDLDAAAAEFDGSATAEGVLLFEEADVTEISAADWDDWHPAEPYSAESGKRAFDPLLDFDQVEADWKNSAVEFSFDAVGAFYSNDHHCGLTAENEQELEAFLGTADTEELDEDNAGYHDSVNEVESTDKYSDGIKLSDDYLSVHTINSEAGEAAAAQEGPYYSLHASEEFAVNEPSVEGTYRVFNDADADADGWAHEISVQANCGFLEVTIPKGKELHVAAAAAVTMGLSLHEQLQAGSGVRAWLLAKGFIINTYEAIESAGNVGITAITHGMVCAIDASDFPVMVQQNAYLASTGSVQLNADQSRLNPVVNACKWIHCSGAGELWLNAQGLWEMVEVDGCYRINSRYLMAFSKSLELKAPPLAGLKSYLTSGGGVECRLTGRGVVWVQTDASRAPVLWQKAS